jgi:hypothetical protein
MSRPVKYSTVGNNKLEVHASTGCIAIHHDSSSRNYDVYLHPLLVRFLSEHFNGSPRDMADFVLEHEILHDMHFEGDEEDDYCSGDGVVKSVSVMGVKYHYCHDCKCEVCPTRQLVARFQHLYRKYH